MPNKELTKKYDFFKDKISEMTIDDFCKLMEAILEGKKYE